MPLRLIFMGTPEFAVPTLRALHADGHEIVAVYTRAAKPAKRGMKEQTTAVAQEATRLELRVLTPTTLRDPEVEAEFRAHDADAAVVVAYGMILSQTILDTPKYGCFNLHASLLPRWRGAAPINRAIMAGDVEGGVMVMRMEAGLDTGDVVMAASTQITDTTTSSELGEVLADIGAKLMVRTMHDLEHHRLTFVRQSDVNMIYAPKIGNSETRIDWTMPAHKVLRHIHGLSPSPGAWCEMPVRNQIVRVKILRCELTEGFGLPGELLDDRLAIACGQGAVRILELQPAGKGPMNARAFLSGAQLKPPFVIS